MFLKLIAVRLLLVLVVFLAAWLTTWVTLTSAALIAASVGGAMLLLSAYEAFFASGDRPGALYVAVAAVVVALALALPLWGSPQFWPAMLAGLLVAALMVLTHRKNPAPTE